MRGIALAPKIMQIKHFHFKRGQKRYLQNILLAIKHLEELSATIFKHSTLHVSLTAIFRRPRLSKFKHSIKWQAKLDLHRRIIFLNIVFRFIRH